MTKDEKMAADEALLMLHNKFAEDGGVDYATMTAEERTAYNNAAKRRQRKRERDLKNAGRLAPTETNFRRALADAALLLLTAGGPGSGVVRDALLAAFAGMPGVVLTVEQRARSGKLGLKVVSVERLEEIRAQGKQAAAVSAAQPTVASPLAEPSPTAPSAAITAVRTPAPARRPADDDDDFEVPLFLRRAHGEA